MNERFLNIRCCVCDEVKLSKQTVEELEQREISAEDICMHCFICEDCDSEMTDGVVAFLQEKAEEKGIKP